MAFPDEDLTRDAFLGGKLMLFQPRKGYRAATDPVWLAAAVPARPGDTALDLGCGAGAAMLCLGRRVPGLSLTGLEVQPDYAQLARRNAVENGIQAEVLEGSVADPPPALKDRAFDHVLTNPPFYAQDRSVAPHDSGRDAAHRTIFADLEDFIALGLRRLRPGGTFALIHRTEALQRALTALAPKAGDIRILPLQPRTGRPAGRFVLLARKGAKGPLQLLAPLVVHDGGSHLSDAADFTSDAEAVLRDGAPLAM